MKKFYSLLSVALGASLCAPALQAEITSVDQLYGTYNAVYAWGFYDQNGEPDGEPDILITPKISAGDQANQIKIEGLFPTIEGNDYFSQDANLPIYGTVDIANQTVTIKGDQVLGVDNTGTNTLYFGKFNEVTGDFDQANEAVCTIGTNGDIYFPIDYSVVCTSLNASGSPIGSWYVYYTLVFQPYNGQYEHPASYYAGEYSASFEWYTEDANGNPLAPPNELVKPNIVVDGENEVEIMNLYPYLNSNIDIEAEVLPSGCLKIDNIQMFEFGSSAYQLIIFDENFLMPDYVLAYPDSNGNLTFPESYTIGMGSYSGANYNFQGLYGYQKLSLNKGEAGIESLDADNANAPVIFYDLNGLKVANPKAGQLLIRKQGKETKKVLVK